MEKRDIEQAHELMDNLCDYFGRNAVEEFLVEYYGEPTTANVDELDGTKEPGDCKWLPFCSHNCHNVGFILCSAYPCKT